MSTNRSAAGAPTTVSVADEDVVKRIVTDTLFGLWATVNNLTRLRPSKRERYRVTVFGSALTQPERWMYFACAFVGRLHQAGAAAGSDVAAQRTQSRGHAFDLLVRAEERVKRLMDWTAAQMLRGGSRSTPDIKIACRRGQSREQLMIARASRARQARRRQPAMTSEPVRTGLAPETLSRAVLDNLACLQARYPGHRDASRLVHGARLQRARPHAGTLGQHGAGLRARAR